MFNYSLTKVTIRDKRSAKHISLHTHTSVFTRATMPCEAFEKNSWGVAYLRWSGEQKLFSGSRPSIPSPKVPFVTKCRGKLSCTHSSRRHACIFTFATSRACGRQETASFVSLSLSLSLLRSLSISLALSLSLSCALSLALALSLSLYLSP